MEKSAPAKPKAIEGATFYLEQARKLYADFQFDGILPNLEFALADKSITLVQKKEVYRLKAYTYAAFDDAINAQKSFVELIKIDRTYDVSGASPKIRGYFAEAQKAYRESLAVKLKSVPPKASQMRATTTVDVLVTAGADRVRTVTLHYRKHAPGGTAYSEINMVAGDTGGYSSPIPNLFFATRNAPEKKGTQHRIEYFVRARGSGGELLAEIGDENNPLAIDVEALPEAPSILRSPWFWTGAAAAVALGIAVPLLITQRNTGVQAGSLGREKLP